MSINPQEYVGALTMAFTAACKGSKPAEWVLDAETKTNEKGQDVFTFRHLRDKFSMTVTDEGVNPLSDEPAQSFSIKSNGGILMNVSVPECWKNIRV